MLDLKVDAKVSATTHVAAAAADEVEVNRKAGAVRVTHVCVGHDCGPIIDPDGLPNQIEGGVTQTVSRTWSQSKSNGTAAKSPAWTGPVTRSCASRMYHVSRWK